MKTSAIFLLCILFSSQKHFYQKGGQYLPFDTNQNQIILNKEQIQNSEYKSLLEKSLKTFYKKYGQFLSSDIQINSMVLPMEIKQIEYTAFKVKYDLMVSGKPMNSFDVEYFGYDSITRVIGLPLKKQKIASLKKLEKYIDKMSLDINDIEFISLETNNSSQSYYWNIQMKSDTINDNKYILKSYNLNANVNSITKSNVDTVPMKFVFPIFDH